MYGDFDEKLAELVVKYAIKVQKGSLVRIRSPANAEPLIREIYRQIIIAGGHVVRQDYSFPGMQEILYKHAAG